MGKLTDLLVAGLLVLASCTANAADRQVTDPKGNNIRLYEKPCVSKKGVLATLPDSARANMKAASVYWDGQNYEACWHQTDDKRVFVFDEAGDAGFMDNRIFVPLIET